jgi:hypothetical protein
MACVPHKPTLHSPSTWYSQVRFPSSQCTLALPAHFPFTIQTNFAFTFDLVLSVSIGYKQSNALQSNKPFRYTNMDDKKRSTIMLNASNYARWLPHARASLGKATTAATTAWDHVNPALPAPAIPVNAGSLRNYENNEKQCVAFLASTLSDNSYTLIQQLIRDEQPQATPSPARLAFQAIHDYHAAVSRTTAEAHENKIKRHKFTDTRASDAMEQWLAADQGLYNIAVNNGSTLTEADYIQGLVKRLPDSHDYKTFKTVTVINNGVQSATTILQTHITLNGLYARICEQRVDDIGASTDQAQALAAVTEKTQLEQVIALLTAQRDHDRGDRRQRADERGDRRQRTEWRTPAQKKQLEEDKRDGVCNLHRHGRCKFGASCKFTHSNAEANMAYALVAHALPALGSESDSCSAGDLLVWSSDSETDEEQYGLAGNHAINAPRAQWTPTAPRDFVAELEYQNRHWCLQQLLAEYNSPGDDHNPHDVKDNNPLVLRHHLPSLGDVPPLGAHSCSDNDSDSECDRDDRGPDNEYRPDIEELVYEPVYSWDVASAHLALPLEELRFKNKQFNFRDIEERKDPVFVKNPVPIKHPTAQQRPVRVTDPEGVVTYANPVHEAQFQEALSRARLTRRGTASSTPGSLTTALTATASNDASPPSKAAALATTARGEDGDTWVADTGANAYIVRSAAARSCMTNYRAHKTVVMMNQHPTTSPGKGDLGLRLPTGNGGFDDIVAKDALWVPESHYNLAAISCLLKDTGRACVTTSTTLTVTPALPSTMTAGAQATLRDGMYKWQGVQYFKPTSGATAMPADTRLRSDVAVPSLTVHTPPPRELTEIHRRLQHLSLGKIQQMVRRGAISASEDVKLAILRCNSLRCAACEVAKSTVMPHPRKQAGLDVSSPVPGLYHLDLFGPLPRSRGGSVYGAPLVHASTTMTVLGLQPNKSAQTTVAEFDRSRRAIEAKTGQPMTVLRTDGGGEFKAEFEEYLAQHNIVHQRTASHSSAQNSKVERMNRTMREGSTASHIVSGLPTTYWPYSWRHTTDILERLPTTANDGISPRESVSGFPPSLADAQPFGCLAFFHTPKQQRRKSDILAGRAQVGIYLGKDTGTADSKLLLNIKTGAIITRRSVRFDPNRFPARERRDAHGGPRTMPPPELGAADYRDEHTAGLIKSLLGAHKHTDASHGGPVSQPPAALADPGHGPVPGDAHNQELEQPGDAPEQGRDQQQPRVQRQRHPTNLFDPAAYDAQRRHDKNAQPSAMLAAANDPNGVADAMQRPDADEWVEVIKDEVANLEANNTWEFADLPAGRSLIYSMIVLRTKLLADGAQDKKKARICPLGYLQREGLDYDGANIFAPTLRWTTVRFLIALATTLDVPIWCHDVTAAFLIPPLKEEIYMLPPKGVDVGLPKGKVLRLLKCLYGLKQSSHEWAKHLANTLTDLGFERAKADPCLFLRIEDGRVTAAIAVYVDDTLVLAQYDDQLIIAKQLREQYNMTGGAPITSFLGVHFRRSTAGFYLDQAAYVGTLLDKMDMAKCRPISTPAEPRVPPPPETPDQEELSYMATFTGTYRTVVGGILYLSNCTRPDIAYATNQLARHMASPRKAHWRALQRLCRYLQATRTYGLRYSSEEEKPSITGYSDSDWATDATTRRSVSGSTFIFAGAAVSWHSKMQKTVALSTCEAEIVALAAMTQEAIWLKRLECDLQPERHEEPIALYCDNQCAIKLAHDRKFSHRTKHVDIKHFFIRDNLESGDFSLEYCDTTRMIADIMTKALLRIVFERLRRWLGVVDTAPGTDTTEQRGEEEY